MQEVGLKMENDPERARAEFRLLDEPKVNIALGHTGTKDLVI